MKKQHATNRYETPEAIRHDAQTLVDDARALWAATAEIADDKVTQARSRLADALEKSEEMCNDVRARFTQTARAADRAVHEHPYPAMGVIFGVGALVGFLLSRRT
jgi:ElaB/YqjD/DUF883 family membrane-anchored ribosome-binding protein